MGESRSKLQPRNQTARRAAAAGLSPLVAGNSVATLLESGVANCFPGLECDIRNLERRFFPFLAVDTVGGMMRLRVGSVDVAGAQAAHGRGEISNALLAEYQRIAADPKRWQIVEIEGVFGPLGEQLFTVGGAVPSFGPDRPPVDAWTAIRLLTEGSDVTLRLRAGGESATLSGRRQAYLDPDGALAGFFEPGEMTQSLCSPWTHDFRDCGCYYWATNHPDIVLPPRIPGDEEATRNNLDTDWQRRNRSLDNPQVASPDGATAELRYHEISHRWQELNFVIERREQTSPYRAANHGANPLPDRNALIAHLRYAAGVELALTLEYLAATWSLRRSDSVTDDLLAGDLRASATTLIEIAVGEMRHLRGVNDVLRRLQGDGYEPALQVATRIPVGLGQYRDHRFLPLLPEVIQDFVEIEAPSRSVDSLYGPILASLEKEDGEIEAAETVRTIMAEGEGHWQSFRNMAEWLGRHDPDAYLRARQEPPEGHPAQAALRLRYEALLDTLHRGYAKGRVGGAVEVNDAKAAMLSGTGLRGALDAVAEAGFLPIFEALGDPRFVPIGHPDGL
jgi:hypothetical protein